MYGQIACLQTFVVLDIKYCIMLYFKLLEKSNMIIINQIISEI